MCSDLNSVNASRRDKEIEIKLHIKWIQLLVAFEEKIKW